ncbi:TnsA-like heteromeric transposase endonuclease subunit [Streptomyces sp. NPDC088727]|uniref:TnsA-like heteromeric transposase endonuclease subunit n=1 Tax=Streptomyces sp. NPDC088727 TaxID=3365875 RepID=UPI00382995BA
MAGATSSGGLGKRRHAPDYFVRLADGRARVVDVRSEDQVDEPTAKAFAATERPCSGVGWGCAHVGAADPVFTANVRWLSRYRHRRCGGDTDVAGRLLEVLRRPRRLGAGAKEAERGKDSLFPPAGDRKLTAPNDRIDLVLLIFDALYEGLPPTHPPPPLQASPTTYPLRAPAPVTSPVQTTQPKRHRPLQGH